MPRWFKNFIGFIRKSGSCPNCGDSFFKKEVTGIQYVEEIDGLGEIIHSASMIICLDCYSSPKDIDPSRIRSSLQNSGWHILDADKAFEAIVRFTKKETVEA